MAKNKPESKKGKNCFYHTLVNWMAPSNYADILSKQSGPSLWTVESTMKENQLSVHVICKG
ncbi:hypothetical protein [Neobacillus drentensis]|uniref:hypothetical protein n=1 Tax=Neobacillus drentensis TaxID=220684 RepID=UPI002FFF1353